MLSKSWRYVRAHVVLTPWVARLASWLQHFMPQSQHSRENRASSEPQYTRSKYKYLLINIYKKNISTNLLLSSKLPLRRNDRKPSQKSHTKAQSELTNYSKEDSSKLVHQHSWHMHLWWKRCMRTFEDQMLSNVWCFHVKYWAYLLSLLLGESVSDGVLDGGAWTLVDHRIPKRDLQEARDHQHQVRCVTQGDCHAPIILCCRRQSEREVPVITY